LLESYTTCLVERIAIAEKKMASMRQVGASRSDEMDGAENQVHCWACRALVVIPIVNGVQAGVFKVCTALREAQMHPNLSCIYHVLPLPLARGMWR
jgi:hypothetical protein